MNKEPAVIISTITAFLAAVLGFGVAFGLDLSSEQRDAVLSVVAPAVAVLFLIGPVIRQFVWSPNSVQDEIDAAAELGPDAPRRQV